MTDKIYMCNICNRIYKNYSSLWHHNKKFHKKPEEIVIPKSLQCEYCNKIFNTRSAKSIHKKKCNKDNKNNIYNIEKIKLEQLKEENIKIKEHQKLIKLEIDKINKLNKNTNNNEIFKNTNGYIYIIQLREFISLNQNIYKIGRHHSDENPIKRLKQYPKDSKCHYFRSTNNQIDSEKEILKICKDNFIHRVDIGNEYFEGNIDLLIKQVNNYFDINASLEI